MLTGNSYCDLWWFAEQTRSGSVWLRTDGALRRPVGNWGLPGELLLNKWPLVEATAERGSLDVKLNGHV